MKYFADKTVYITGGSSGIGLAVASLFAAEGAHVIIFARRSDRLESALKQIMRSRTSNRQRFSCMQIDVSDKDDVEAAISKAIAEFGVPEVLINCAGIAHPFNFEDITYDRFNETIKTNLYGTRNTIATLVPHMKKEGGHIVNVSSMSGLIGAYGYSDYSASKFGLIGFSEALRSELKQYGIQVSVLCPPDTDTPGLQEENKTKPEETRALTARTKLMQPDNVARVLVNGIKQGKFLIIPGFEGKFYFMMKRLFPGLVTFMMDRDIRKVRERKS
jgi:3-dehydrosphinganine reductase